MSEHPRVKLSAEQRRSLRNERFISEVIKVRKAGSSEDSKPIWLQVLESNSVAALITVILGGIVGQIIITSVQDYSKRSEQTLAETKHYLERQREVVQIGSELVERCVFDSQTLISLTKPEFQLSRFLPNDQQSVRKQREELLAKHNRLIEEWRIGKNKIGAEISYYDSDQRILQAAWRENEQSVEKLLECAQATYNDYSKDPTATEGKSDLCKQVKDDVETKIGNLVTASEKAHQYKWEALQRVSDRTTATEIIELALSFLIGAVVSWLIANRYYNKVAETKV